MEYKSEAVEALKDFIENGTYDIRRKGYYKSELLPRINAGNMRHEYAISKLSAARIEYTENQVWIDPDGNEIEIDAVELIANFPPPIPFGYEYLYRAKRGILGQRTAFRLLVDNGYSLKEKKVKIDVGC